MMEVLSNEFIKFCYEGFRDNDEKFPDYWTLDDYEKNTEECNRILEKADEKRKI